MARDNATLVDVPVLIVGGGPTGLLTAFMLSVHGVKSLLIEKYPQRLAAPKAHALSPRTLEICRQYGLDTNNIRKWGSPRNDAYWVNFLTNLSGQCIGTLPYERMDAQVLESTPEMIHNIPQPDFENLIAEKLLNDPNVQILKGTSFVSCQESGEQVITTVADRTTKASWCVRSRHVIACDGARSQVRKFLDIESSGEDGYDTMMTIHFQADLRSIVKERVGMLHWILDPACFGFIIAYDLEGNQVLISNYDSAKHPAETWTDELSRATVCAAIGQDVPVNILSHRPWLLSRTVAKEYRRGNVFLVGDAAHSFPPTGGLGLNSGLADAHNLAYKIAAIHQGWAAPPLLDTYEYDRRPVALVNSAQSVKNGKKIFAFLKALGTAGIEDLDKARENMLKTIRDPAKQDLIAGYIEAQREHFDNLELHIGYVYGEKDPPTHASHFTPKFKVGARLPHAWIKPAADVPLPGPPIDTTYIEEFSHEEVAARRFSTLDLVPPGFFTLITASQPAWIERVVACKAMLKNMGCRLQVWHLGYDFEFEDDIHFTLYEEGAQFARGGALLVRPDQHILECLRLESTSKDIALVILGHLGF